MSMPVAKLMKRNFAQSISCNRRTRACLVSWLNTKAAPTISGVKFDIRHGELPFTPLHGTENGTSGGSTAMARFLIMLGLVILVIGLLWPYLSRIGLGRLPGDIVIERDNVTFYFPIVTCLLLSLVFSVVLWAVNR
jgi:hypothetical protein